MSTATRAGLSPNGSPKPSKHGEPSALQAAAQREIAAASGAGAVDATTGVAVGHVSNYLSLRLDRPLEGCQLRPRVYVYSKLMTTTGVANKAYSNTDHRFLYTWSRGPERQVREVFGVGGTRGQGVVTETCWLEERCCAGGVHAQT